MNRGRRFLIGLILVVVVGLICFLILRFVWNWSEGAMDRLTAIFESEQTQTEREGEKSSNESESEDEGLIWPISESGSVYIAWN